MQARKALATTTGSSSLSPSLLLLLLLSQSLSSRLEIKDWIFDSRKFFQEIFKISGGKFSLEIVEKRKREEEEEERRRRREKKKKREERRETFGARTMYEGVEAEEEDPEQWTRAGWKELETLEEACRCAICGEFFDTPVSVANCGHTFCSLCIRRNIEYQLRSNRALDNNATCPQVRPRRRRRKCR